MIALISFKEDVVTTREEAGKLNLEYQENKRFGYDNNKLKSMPDYYCYRDEVIKREDGKYFKDDKEIAYYCICDRPEKILDWVTIKKENNLVDLEWFALNCRFPFYIEKCIKSEEATIPNIQSLLNKIEEKTAQLNKTIDIMKQQTFNQKCDVHVGGGMIATYNDLMLKENSCTDALQSELNNGWRIIAVCVQPDQRRPDYILGRYNPQLDTYEKQNADR